MIAKLELYGIIIAVALLTAFGWGQYMKHEGRVEERAVWEAKQAAATKADLDGLKQAIGMSNQIALDTSAKIDKVKGQRIIDRGVIEHEISTNTVYTTDCFAPAGLVQWNALSAGRALVPSGSAGQQADAAVPAGNGTPNRGQQGRNPLTKPSGSGGVIQRVP